MRGGIVLVVIGLFLGWLAVSGKYCCLSQMWGCASSDSAKPCECGGGDGKTPANVSQVNFSDLLKPLDLPGAATYPYA